jgi:hypothetical protein
MVHDGEVDSEEPDTVDITAESECGCETQTLDVSLSQASGDACKKGNVRVEFSNVPGPYDIVAKTLSEVRFQFKFFDEKQKVIYAAETRSGEPQIIKSKSSFDSRGRLICGEVIVPITAEFPIWNGVNSLCKPIQDEWERFQGRIVDIIRKGFANFGEKIQGKTLDQIEKIVTSVEEKIQQDHDSYDKRTKHGIRQEADLNLKIDSQCK